MKPKTANLLNSAILFLSGIYGYFFITTATGEHAPTALIPTFFATVLIIIGIFWERVPKIVSHVVILLTLVLLFMCVVRFVKIDLWEAKKYLFLICIFSNAAALSIFIKSFIDARKKPVQK